MVPCRTVGGGARERAGGRAARVAAAACADVGDVDWMVVADMADQLEVFRHSLAETIAWGGPRAPGGDPAVGLRTPALLPSPLDWPRSTAERQASVEALVGERARLLRDAGADLAAAASDLAGGRLLLFDPDGTLSDGAAALASRGFFDDDNVPPWDTGVLYAADPLTPTEREAERAMGRREGHWSHVPPYPPGRYPKMGAPYYLVDPIPEWREAYLVCWVPPRLLRAAHSGVVVNPEACIEWLADRDTPFTRALRELDLLM